MDYDHTLMEVAAKKLQILTLHRRSIHSAQIQGGHPSLVSLIQYLTKCETCSQVMVLSPENSEGDI